MSDATRNMIMRKTFLVAATALGLAVATPAFMAAAPAMRVAGGEAVVNDQHVADVSDTPAMVLAGGEALVNDQHTADAGNHAGIAQA